MWVQQAVALALTIGAILFSIVAFAAVAIVPAFISFFAPPDGLATLVGLARWPILAVLVCISLAIVYRFGPPGTGEMAMDHVGRCDRDGSVVAVVGSLFGLCLSIRKL
jgi:uncharacterized BrkB/YihY/UPF0761 family membrane protein